MKKLFVVMGCIFCMAPAFAQQRILERTPVPVQTKRIERSIERATISARGTGASEVAEAYDQFVNFAYEHQYHEYAILFMRLDQLRAKYMELYEKQPQWAIVLARRLVRPVELDHGTVTITIPSYIRMESVNLLTSEEQEKFEAFGALLERNAQAAQEILPSRR